MLNPPKPRKLISVLLLALILCLTTSFPSTGMAAEIDLAPLLDSTAPGNTLSLDSANTYFLSNEYSLKKSLTLAGNGALLRLAGPINIQGTGVSVNVSHCKISSTGWGALAVQTGASLTVNNSSEIDCADGTGIYINAGSSAGIVDTTITNCFLGVNITNNSNAALQRTSISDTPYAVQVSGSDCQVEINDECEFTNLGTDEATSGTGIGILSGGSAKIYDSTFYGFANAIDLHRNDPPATAEIIGCKFYDNRVSALSAIGAHDITFSNCYVARAWHDGIYLANTTGIIDKCEIIESRNTGVTFWGCENGATIKNSLIRNSEHQGIGIVRDTNAPPNSPSLDIKVLDNTLYDNKITNVLIDQYSTAVFQGNIFYQSDTFSRTEEIPSIRIDGSQHIHIDSCLFTTSDRGFEIRNNGQARIQTSIICENDLDGILAYNNAVLSLENCILKNNNLAGGNYWSIFGNDPVSISCIYTTLANAGAKSIYNNTSTNQFDFRYNYWDAQDGPRVTPLSLGTTGSVIDWNWNNWETSLAVKFQPYLTSQPVASSHKYNVRLETGYELTWESDNNLTINLSASPGIQPLDTGRMAVLKNSATENHELDYSFPLHLIPGQHYSVWISADLLHHCSLGSLEFHLPDTTQSSLALFRRNPNGTWDQVDSNWNQTDHVLQYACNGDISSINGTFAIAYNDFSFVDPSGDCGTEHLPCYQSIQNAASDNNYDVMIMKIRSGNFRENPEFQDCSRLIFLCGYNPSFTAASGTTTVMGITTIGRNGCLILENGLLELAGN